MNTEPKTESSHAATLFAGLTAAVVHEDGSTETVKVRQLPLRTYETAMQLLNDEFAITAFCVERTTDKGPLTADKNWILTLQPESYSELVSKSEHVNKSGFFVYAARQTEKQRRESQELIQGLDPDRLKALSELGRSALANGSPRPRPISR